MLSRWLIDLPASLQWAALRSPEFAERPVRVAVLPVFGHADHGAVQSLDLEECLGTALLRATLSASPECKVLPPLRHGPTPYPQQCFGCSLETTRSILLDLGRSLRESGVRTWVLFSSSPWHEEWLAACAVDVREAVGLDVVVITFRGLGLDLHPASLQRGTGLLLAGFLGAGEPQATGPLPGGRDNRFRPGDFSRPHSPAPATAADADQAWSTACSRLRALWSELGVASASDASLTPAPASSPTGFGALYRERYLGGVSAARWPQAAELAESLVVIPTGAIEQHGPHLPLAVDAVLGQAYLEAALARLPSGLPVWVAPPLAVGRSNEHRGFAGTLSLSTSTFHALVRDLVEGLVARGAQRIAFLNTHGGNSAALIPLLREMQAARGIRAGVVGGLFRPALPEPEAAAGFHAGEWETSLYLALAPEAVRTDLAVREFPPTTGKPSLIRPEGGIAARPWLTADLSRSGVMGDATVATAEKGRVWLDAVGLSLAERLTQLAAC